MSRPVQRRCGTPNPPFGDTRACSSTRIGRVPSSTGTTTDPGRSTSAWPSRKNADGLAISSMPLCRHAKHGGLVGRTEAVLDRAQEAHVLAAPAFEVQGDVDEVLDRLRTGEGAVLRDVADEERHEPARLRDSDEFARRLRAAGGCSRPRRPRRSTAPVWIESTIRAHGDDLLDRQPRSDRGSARTGRTADGCRRRCGWRAA